MLLVWVHSISHEICMWIREIVVWLIHGINWFSDEIIEWFCSELQGSEAVLPVPVWNVPAWDLCPLRVQGMLAGLIPAILSTPLCLLPQHCLNCLEGYACASKGCNHSQCWSMERASLRLVSTLSHQVYWQGPVAQCQCLETSVSVLGDLKELRRIKFWKFHFSPLIKKNQK